MRAEKGKRGGHAVGADLKGPNRSRGVLGKGGKDLGDWKGPLAERKVLVGLAMVVVQVDIADHRAEGADPLHGRNHAVAMGVAGVEASGEAGIVHAGDQLGDHIGSMLVHVLEVDEEIGRFIGQEVAPEGDTPFCVVRRVAGAGDIAVVEDHPADVEVAAAVVAELETVAGEFAHGRVEGAGAEVAVGAVEGAFLTGEFLQDTAVPLDSIGVTIKESRVIEGLDFDAAGMFDRQLGDRFG